jgi:hypothetical protein
VIDALALESETLMLITFWIKLDCCNMGQSKIAWGEWGEWPWVHNVEKGLYCDGANECIRLRHHLTSLVSP